MRIERLADHQSHTWEWSGRRPERFGVSRDQYDWLIRVECLDGNSHFVTIHQRQFVIHDDEIEPALLRTR